MVSCGFWTLVKLQSEIKQKFAHNARTKTALSGNILSARTHGYPSPDDKSISRPGLLWHFLVSTTIGQFKVLHKSTFKKHLNI